MLCTYLEISIENIAHFLQNWIIENQWGSLAGKNISETDIAFALTTRSNDYQDQFTYAYSKQVGLQSRGPWELKKDYFKLEDGKQVYQVPAGREINEVLWATPPTIDHALYANYGGLDYGFGGGVAQMGTNSTYGLNGSGGMGAYYIAPAFDTLLLSTDMDLKNRMMRSDLLYKVTAGPEGTKFIHLMSTPGSSLSFGHGIGSKNSLSMRGCYVWYHYYDTTLDNVDECRNANKDIIKLPNEVPLSRLSFDDFNEPTKVYVRRLLVAEAKRALGRVRGKFNGSLAVPDSDLSMDYESLISEGNDEINGVFEEFVEFLTKLSTNTHLERKAEEAENVNKAKKYSPMKWTIS
jgi:hypothetical protein